MRSAEGGAIATAASKVIRGDPARRRGGSRRRRDSFLEVGEAETAARQIVRLVAGGIKGYKTSATSRSSARSAFTPSASCALNKAIQQQLNPQGRLSSRSATTVFRVGDKVLVTKNDYELLVFNGDTGVVSSVSAAGARERPVWVRVQDGATIEDGREIRFEKEHLRTSRSPTRSPSTRARAASTRSSSSRSTPATASCSTGSSSTRRSPGPGRRSSSSAQRKAISRAVRNVDPMTRNTSLWARIRYLNSKPVQTSAPKEGV
jgi:ribosomal protein L21E